MADKQVKARAFINGVAVWCAFDEMKALEDLAPHPKNNNTHPKQQLELLGEIIQESGWRACITVSSRSGYITKGHGRLLAAKHKGFAAAPVEYQDYPDEAAELADLLADNKIAQLAEFDDKATKTLLAELQELDFDVELAGFDLTEVEPLEDPPESPPDDNYAEQHGVIVLCRDETHQREVFDFLKSKNYTVKVVAT